ncbi:hypothetical protein Z959_02645 [Clostridium novyi B str. ATCC 27606]|uniref:Uncharacterized protein n=1 Tax=Clostridium novyi B str. ATCC 27606 TaxID=1443123 RepID=A0AA40M4S5_CLONO|nr:hypothetical protein [Clostridium novyi]KEI13571.1 hypothetical protein Z959_02645 [Clostridium novyi B str. ATCC 27606]
MIRNIIYNQDGKNIILEFTCEEKPNLENIKVLQIEDKEEYKNMKKFHIQDGNIIIDDVYKKEISKEEKLEKELLETKATLVDLKYKEFIENTEKVGK